MTVVDQAFGNVEGEDEWLDEQFINLYATAETHAHRTRGMADMNAHPDRVAILHVTATGDATLERLP